MDLEPGQLWCCDNAVTCCDPGCGREQGRVPVNVLLDSRLERAHRRSDPPLGDAVSTGCTGQGHSGHHQGQWHDPWYQGGQGLQQEAWIW